MKWKRNILSQQGQPSSINVVDTNTIGPTQQVPQSFESPLEALNLTLPDACIDTVVRYTNQKYEQYCGERPRGSVARCFRGYRPFSKKIVLAFMAYHLSLELIKLPNPISDLYESKFLPLFKAALSRDRLLLLTKYSRYDDLKTRMVERMIDLDTSVKSGTLSISAI